MIEIGYSEIKEEKKKELIKIMIANGCDYSEHYTDDDEFIDDQLSQNCDVDGSLVPYVAEQGPSYSSGGQPAEGGYFEDITISLGKVDITEFITDSGIESMNDYLMEG